MFFLAPSVLQCLDTVAFAPPSYSMVLARDLSSVSPVIFSSHLFRHEVIMAVQYF